MTDLAHAGQRLRALGHTQKMRHGLDKDGGLFSGYASVFGQVDGGGDMIMPGAFEHSLLTRNSANIRMLFQHDPSQPIGRWVQMFEDHHGLFVMGQLTQGVQRSTELTKLLSHRAIDGLSIGFKTVRARRDHKTGVRKIFKLDLWEVSLVTFPMLHSARVAPQDETIK